MVASWKQPIHERLTVVTIIAEHDALRRRGQKALKSLNAPRGSDSEARYLIDQLDVPVGRPAITIRGGRARSHGRGCLRNNKRRVPYRFETRNCYAKEIQE